MGFLLEKIDKIEYFRYDKIAPDLKAPIKILNKCDDEIAKESVIIIPALDDKNISSFNELKQSLKNNITHIIVDSLSITNYTLEEASFDNLIFIDANFEGTVFSKLANFNNSIFYTSKFDFTNFSNVSFNNSKFKLITSFKNATFSSASFSNVMFNESVDFNHASFLHLSTFNNTVFNFRTSFNSASFNIVNFENTTFNNVTDFDSTLFKEAANFEGALFNKEISFQNITVNSDINFANAILSKANFSNSTFSNANFTNAKFIDNSSFGGTKFFASNFFKTKFEGMAIFDSSTHVGTLDFKKTTFATLSIANIKIAKHLFLKKRKIATLKLGLFHFVDEASLKELEYHDLVIKKYVNLLDDLQDARSLRKTSGELADIYEKMDNPKMALLFNTLKKEAFNVELRLKMNTGAFNNVKYNLILIRIAISEIFKSFAGKSSKSDSDFLK